MPSSVYIYINNSYTAAGTFQLVAHYKFTGVKIRQNVDLSIYYWLYCFFAVGLSIWDLTSGALLRRLYSNKSFNLVLSNCHCMVALNLGSLYIMGLPEDEDTDFPDESSTRMLHVSTLNSNQSLAISRTKLFAATSNTVTVMSFWD